MPELVRDVENFGPDTQRRAWAYPVEIEWNQAIGIIDVDYDVFIRDNAFIFEHWKGALSHSELCKMDVMTRYKYIQHLNKFIKEKQKQQDGNKINLGEQ